MNVTTEQETKAEVWIPLSQGKVAVIDFDDFEKVRPYKWYARAGRGDTWYARTNVFCKEAEDRTGLEMHRLLTDAPDGILVDHKDRDGLNNRRYNLRVATRSQNQHNRKKQKGSSKFKGVCWYKLTNRWRAQIHVKGHHRSLGLFQSEEAAARAYDAAAIKYFGEYARINFPGE